MKEWFRNMKISTKITLFGFIVTIFTILLTGLLILQLFLMKQDIDSIYKNRVIHMKQLKELSDLYVGNIVNNSYKVKNRILTWDQGINGLKEAQQGIETVLEEYEGSELTEDEAVLFDELKKAKDETDKMSSKLIEAMKAQDLEKLDGLIKSALYQRVDVVTGKIDKLIELQLTVAEEIYDKNSSRYFMILGVSIVVIIISIIIQGILAIVISKSINKSINSFRNLFEKMSDGDLTKFYEVKQRIKVNKKTGKIKECDKNEMDQLGVSYNNLINNLRKIIIDISSDGGQTASSAVQLSEGMNIISEATQMQTNDVVVLEKQIDGLKEKMDHVLDNIRNQTASVEETSSGINEIFETMQSVFESTQNTMKISEETKKAAEIGEKSAVNSFEGIKNMEKIISDIDNATSSISKISEQTNLLALNAAIEAARAGEAGRGFSIVAEEVRKLADMTKTSVNDIGNMILKAKDTMKQNLYLAEHSEEQLKEIIKKAEKTNDEIEKVSKAMSEQRLAIEEITKAVLEVSNNSSNVESLSIEQLEIFDQIREGANNISKQAQAISVGTEESLSVAEEVAGIADNLNEMISVFKV